MFISQSSVTAMKLRLRRSVHHPVILIIISEVIFVFNYTKYALRALLRALCDFFYFLCDP
jgi:hypothetical protein